jgi:hypothetical protein
MSIEPRRIRMRRWALLLALGLPLLAVAGDEAGAQQRPGGPPHEWAYGVWTGGQFPPGDGDTQACYGAATFILLRDVVLRSTPLDVAFRQRLIETVASMPDGGLEIRLVPAAPMGGPFGGRVPPDAGFGCDGNPNLLKIERRGPNEVVFPECRDFPSPLRRCTGAAR